MRKGGGEDEDVDGKERKRNEKKRKESKTKSGKWDSLRQAEEGESGVDGRTIYFYITYANVLNHRLLQGKLRTSTSIWSPGPPVAKHPNQQCDFGTDKADKDAP